MRSFRMLPLVALMLLTSPASQAATEYQCGAGKPNAATKRCDCPNGKVENTDTKGVSRCVDAPKARPPSCPGGTEFKAGMGCVPVVRTDCPPGTSWTPGEGCVARVIGRPLGPLPSAGTSLASGQVVEFVTDSGSANWSGEQEFQRSCTTQCGRLSFFAGYRPNGALPVVDRVVGGFFSITALPSKYAPISAVRFNKGAATPASAVGTPTSGRIKPGMRVTAVRTFEKIRAGMQGTYWGTNGKDPPAFVVWDEYIGAGATYYRDEGAPAGRQDYGYWVPWDVISPFAQDCQQFGPVPNYGAVDVGTVLVLGRHRSVNGDENWADEMRPYVGRRVTVSKLVGVDKAGCPVVSVDADNGAHYWRVRDATVP